jgi:hypothetical protein
LVELIALACFSRNVKFKLIHHGKGVGW